MLNLFNLFSFRCFEYNSFFNSKIKANFLIRALALNFGLEILHSNLVKIPKKKKKCTRENWILNGPGHLGPQRLCTTT